MILRELILKNFRNLNIKLTPKTGLNLIVGNNGSGKSNLLDSIYHLALAKSFKPYSLKNNINIDNSSEFSVISGQLENEDLQREIKIIFSQTTSDAEHKRYELNGKATSKAKFLNNLNVILFAPHNINMIVFTPQIRREEFDDFGSICDFRYALALEEYHIVLINRNRLLKAINEQIATIKQLDYWNEKLVKLGSFLIHERQKMIRALGPTIEQYTKEYLKPELRNIELQYISRFIPEKSSEISLQEISTNFKATLEENQSKEIAAKQTLYGPQKDDYCFILNNKLDLKTFGSRGQQRMVILILKLSMWEYLYKIKSIKPIILLDDIMSELDSENKKILERIILSLGSQTFISTTHEKEYSIVLRSKMTITCLDS